MSFDRRDVIETLANGLTAQQEDIMLEKALEDARDIKAEIEDKRREEEIEWENQRYH